MPSEFGVYEKVPKNEPIANRSVEKPEEKKS